MPDGWVLKQTVFDGDQMKDVIRRLAGDILAAHDASETLMLIGIRTRGVPLAEAIAAEIEAVDGRRLAIGTLDITLYRDDLSTIAPQPVVKETRFPGSIDNCRLVLCDDVLFTGRTVRAALGALVDFGRPSRVELAVLIDRGRRELPIQADYIGKAVPTTEDEQIEVRFEATDGDSKVDLLERQA